MSQSTEHQDESGQFGDTASIAKSLSWQERRFFLKVRREDNLDRQAHEALRNGMPPPSRLSRVFSRAETERKLVLFTLGLIVMGLIVVISLQVLRDGDAAAGLTPLVGLAGTGLGFIGGMVEREKPPKNQRQQPER